MIKKSKNELPTRLSSTIKEEESLRVFKHKISPWVVYDIKGSVDYGIDAYVEITRDKIKSENKFVTGKKFNVQLKAPSEKHFKRRTGTSSGLTSPKRISIEHCPTSQRSPGNAKGICTLRSKKSTAATPRPSTMMSPTSTSKSIMRMGSAGLGLRKTAGQIRLSRWGWLWMQTAYPFISIFSQETQWTSRRFAQS